MRTVSVRAPDGRQWNVRREWVPRRPRWVGIGFRASRAQRQEHSRRGGRRSNALDWIDVPIVDELPAVTAVILVIVALVAAWFFVLPVLVFLLDLVFLAVVAAAAVAARVLFRRPWRIVAAPDGPAGARPLLFHVRGLRASRAAVGDIAGQLEAGLSPRVADAPT